MALNWEHGYAHYYLADCYTCTGQLDEAEQAYQKANELATAERDVFERIAVIC